MKFFALLIFVSSIAFADPGIIKPGGTYGSITIPAGKTLSATLLVTPSTIMANFASPSWAGSGSTITVTVSAGHGMTTGWNVTVANCVGGSGTWNGAYTITVTSATQFTYSANGTGSPTGCTFATTSLNISGAASVVYSTLGGNSTFQAQGTGTGIYLAEGQQVSWLVTNSTAANITITWPSGLTLKWRYGTAYSTVYASTSNIYTFMKVGGTVWVAGVDQLQ